MRLAIDLKSTNPTSRIRAPRSVQKASFVRQWKPSVVLHAIGILILAPLVGCESPEPITEYTIPTEMPEQLQPGKERMLAAMLPQADQVWFFKVTGPEDATSEIEDDFRKFVSEIQFVDGSPDLSRRPDNWRRGADRRMRFASFDVTTSSKQLDVSVSSLPRQSDWDNYVAQNINRWRNQLGAEPSTEKWAGAEPIDIPSSDGPAVWFDLVGQPGAATSSMPPMMSQTPSGSDLPVAPARGDPPPEKESPLKFDRPESWRVAGGSSMRLASFNAGPESAPADISVMPAGGDLRGNVQRWLGQVRQGNVPDDVVDQALEAVEERKVAGRDAKRYILTAADPTSGEIIDATIVPMEGNFSMFIKMKGPAETVTEQSDAMSEFLDSLQF